MVAVRISLGFALHVWTQTRPANRDATLDLAAVLQPKVRTDIPCGLRRARYPDPHVGGLHASGSFLFQA